MATLVISDGQLQGQAQVLNGYADTIHSHTQQFNTAVADMQQHLVGTAGTAYQTVSSQTLTPQLNAFITALRDYATTLQQSGGKLDAANGENTQRINSLISSAQGLESTAANSQWTSNINF